MYSPSSTYRIQLNDQFTFRDLEGIIDYLHQLGVSTIYASPITTAFKGSSHGYDVIDPLILSPEIGTEKELERLASTLKGYGMTWLQDIVPNHMAYDSNNPWLYDVLERGKDSPYHSFFDITDHPVELLGEQLMAPFLGQTLTECLQKGELNLQFTE
ncbi:MAG TPA: alpha-amylase family glycosyl hydrolase, partial [Puia sp.]|nr:alpha-amylase family glycosyl hydrolase [Puia sp.]